jgi:CheY-like chemotaxis protein
MASETPVLVVDDDPAILAFVQLALEDAGYEVMIATDGADALQAIRHRRPGLILLDMRMPGMNGWEFADAYRLEPSPHAPLLIMSAGRDTAPAHIAAAGWLRKPFDLDQLIGLVGQLLDSALKNPPRE